MTRFHSFGFGAVAAFALGALLGGCSGEISGSEDPSAGSSAGASNSTATGSQAPGGGASSQASTNGASGAGTTPGSGTTSPGGSTTAPNAGGDATTDGTSTATGTPGTTRPYTEPTATSPELEARTWKLSHAQYQASVEALLGVRISLEGERGPRLAAETSNGMFLNLSDTGFVSIANGLAAGYMEIAAEVSEGVSAEQLAALGDCAALASCERDTFLTNALAKAFRRPATADDLTAFGELFDLAQAEVAVVGDDALAYRSALKAMLTSPYFLYRTEIGDDPTQESFRLTPYEVASFLSYSILGQPPSEQLLAAAEAGTLSDPATLRGQVETLLQQADASEQFERFMTEWLEVEAFLDPDFGLGRQDVKTAEGFDDVKVLMQQETEDFLETNGTLDGTLAALLTAPVEVTDPALAAFYDSEPTGAAAPSDRVGIFALGAGLSMRAKDASTSPTLRGLFVRERLMCQHFEIPPGVNPDLSDLKAQAEPDTTRELYELHALDPSCAGCHALFDPIGFTLETFDEVGRFRSSQTGTPIDTTAKLIASDVDRDLSDHVELASALTESRWVRECLSRQAFRYYFGTTTSLELDSTGTRLEENRGLPPIQQGRAALDAAGNLRAMVTAVLSSESTLARTRREPEAR